MGINMGLHPLIARGGGPRKFRWMFSIDPYVGDQVSMLPPIKSGRPNMSFKEYQAEHLNETIYFPGKVEWQTIELTMYDIKCYSNPMYEWMKVAYDPDPDVEFYGPSLADNSQTQMKRDSIITMYSGCGEIFEQWVYMNSYPSKVDWGDLDMSVSEIVTVEITLRFDRAYHVKNINIAA